MSHPIPPISHRFDSFRYVSYFRYVSRVHIADISRSLIASMLEPSEYAFEAIYNLADDEPAPRAEVMAFAGGLLALPPLEPVGAKRRESTGNLKMVDNYRMRNELLKGEELSFPSYREGLRQLYGEKIRCAAEKEEEAETTAADAETAETAETASAERAPEVRRRMGEGVGDGEGVVGALRRELGRRDPGGCGLCGVVGSHSAALQSATAAESAEAWFEVFVFRPPHPFLPYVAPHFSHISHFNLVFRGVARESCRVADGDAVRAPARRVLRRLRHPSPLQIRPMARSQLARSKQPPLRPAAAPRPSM